MAKEVIHEPFAVINADDFYGKESFQILADSLKQAEGKQNEYCMVGYRVANTLSESGAVARGICSTDENGYLTSVVERTQLFKDKDGVIKFREEDGSLHPVDEHALVSMNMWGFTPDYFKYSEEAFKRFLQENGNQPKAEFFIPLVVNELIVTGKATCKVLDTPSKWFGVTYAEDRPDVVNRLEKLVKEGVYPGNLW
jgi:hypothetical protein